MAWALARADARRALAIIGNLYFYAWHRPSAELVDWAERSLALAGATIEPLAVEAHVVAFFACWRVPDFTTGLQHADAIEAIVSALGLPTPYWPELMRTNAAIFTGERVGPISPEARRNAPAFWRAHACWRDEMLYTFNPGDREPRPPAHPRTDLMPRDLLESGNPSTEAMMCIAGAARTDNPDHADALLTRGLELMRPIDEGWLLGYLYQQLSQWRATTDVGASLRLSLAADRARAALGIVCPPGACGHERRDPRPCAPRPLRASNCR